jgi:hypothetical protein
LPSTTGQDLFGRPNRQVGLANFSAVLDEAASQAKSLISKYNASVK